MAGRTPKPTALKILQGNPGRRPLNMDEPRPAHGAVMPAWLLIEPALVAEWKHHAPRLTALGLLTEIDDDALATLCVLEVRFREAAAVGLSTMGGQLDMTRERRALWARFGMTPADRVKLKAEKPPPESKLSRFTGA